MTLRRPAVLAAMIAASLFLGGCASPGAESRLGDYRTQAEQISDDLVAAVPAELGAQPGLLDSRMTLGADISAHDGPSAPAWWTVDRSITAAPIADAAKDAAAAIGAHLAAEGWTQGSVRENGERTVEGYRKDDWYTEVARYATVPGKAEVVDLTIVSPQTVRGDQ